MTERTERRKYSNELKAAALADVVLLGPGATAAKYGVPVGTIWSWSSRHDPLASLKKERLGELAARYLEANLQALTAQAYVTSDPAYIDRQPAEGLAILHGVMADKAIRLFEALHASHEPAALDAG